ncbi:MAG TPA: zf-HC2 domain-containing protein [Candidatus Dormibacteraeota bacterium]|nr:zf-HC2 domain-containing protein [Candidatus Dormibacteraeota bacterium]
MKCLDFEKLIALDLEGDLPERKGKAVAEHLKVCRRCQEFTEKLKASQTLLKSLAQESVDDGVLQEVRQSVFKSLPTEKERQGFRGWRYALGAGVTAVMVLAAITLWRPWNGRSPDVTRTTPKQTATEAVGQQTPTLAPRSSVRATKGKSVLRRRKYFNSLLTASKGRQQLAIKLVTDDPNVVIYWLVD